MISFIKRQLNQPFPFEYSVKVNLKQAFGISCFVFFFLFLVQPFGVDSESKNVLRDIIVCLGYGIISFIVVFLYDLLTPKLLPGLFLKETVKTGVVLLYAIILIFIVGNANALYNWILNHEGDFFYTWYHLQYYTFIIGVFPTVFIMIAEQNWNLHKHVKGAQLLDKELGEVETYTESDINPSLIIKSENEKDIFNIPSQNLLYIKSAGNYLEVNFIKDDHVKTELLRSTIKRMESELSSHSFIMRCHRMYLINLLNIEHVTGDSQGYRIMFNGLDLQLPVSRGYIKQFRQHFERIHRN